MNLGEKRDFIRRLAAEGIAGPETGHVLWSRHAIVELVNEGWHRTAIEEGLRACEVIEDYPAGPRALPDCLTMGLMESGEPFHAVIAID